MHHKTSVDSACKAQDNCMNLLIIDDDSIASFVHTRIAETSGLFRNIRTVNNGKEALDIFEQAGNGTETLPDVVLVDLNMPLISGFDFIEAFQRMTFPDKERVAIVIVTSSDDSRDVQRARSLGIEYYLVKSHSAKDLQLTLFALAHKKR